MPARLLLIISLLFASTASRGAEPEACLEAPTQECVFDLAVQSAEAQSKPLFWAQAMVFIAYLQESAGAAGSTDTLDAFLQNVEDRATKRRPALTLVDAKALRDIFEKDPFPAAPKAAHRLARYIMDTTPDGGASLDASNRQRAVIFLALAKDYNRMFDLITTAKGEAKVKSAQIAALYLVQNDARDVTRKVLDMIPKWRGRDEVLSFAILSATRRGAFEYAIHLAAEMSTIKSQNRALKNVVMGLLRHDRVADANELVDQMEQKGHASGTAGALARAHAGEAERPKEFPSRFGQNYAMAALISGDYQTTIEYLRYAETKGSYRSTIRNLASAYLRSGETDLSMFFDQLPEQKMLIGLRELGRLQAEWGDLDGARQTFGRADAYSHSQRHPHDENRFAFERALAEAGFIKDAVAPAYQRKDALALAYLATLIPR